jgi:hypothetical protein
MNDSVNKQSSIITDEGAECNTVSFGLQSENCEIKHDNVRSHRWSETDAEYYSVQQ